jgi:uncharacterized protein
MRQRLVSPAHRIIAVLALLWLPAALPAQSPGSAPYQVFEQSRTIQAGSSALKVKPAFLPLPPGAVAPKGWLRDWAVAAANGITGHLDEYSKTFGEAWKGYPFEARGVHPDGTGWPLEQSSYWLDGAVRLAWILNDKALQDKVSKRLDMVVSGVLNGGESFIYWRPESAVQNTFNSWAHSHMGRALVAYYQATGNPRVLEALVKVYRNYPLPGSDYEDVNGAVNLDAMFATYAMSGDRAILERAVAYAQTKEYRDIAAQWSRGQVQPGHNVIFYENIRVPVMLYPWTGDRNDLAATLGAIAWHDRNHTLPMGLSSGEEYHAGIGATRNVETCNVAASMWTYLYLLRVTGDSSYSDRIEKIFFNAGPAPVARDFKTMCYYQSPNRYSSSNPKEEPAAPGPQGYRFTPFGHEVLCCVGNLNRVIPNYLMHMWMATLDGGLAATLYGPASLETTVAGGVKVAIESATAYPFEDTVTLTVTPAREVRFPLYLRLPAWCHAPQIRVNGRVVPTAGARQGFLAITRTWQAHDKLVLRLPMPVRIAQGRETPYPAIEYFANSRRIAKQTAVDSPWATVSYGPLLFSLPIPDENPNQEAPNARYQYALDVSPREAGRGVRVIRRPMPEHWSWPLASPLQLSVKAREFDWQPEELQPLPQQPVKGGKRTKVLLVPYGCTKFRVSMFPVTASAWEGGR